MIKKKQIEITTKRVSSKYATCRQLIYYLDRKRDTWLKFNSLMPSKATWRHRTWSALRQVMICRLFGGRPFISRTNDKLLSVAPLYTLFNEICTNAWHFTDTISKRISRLKLFFSKTEPHVHPWFNYKQYGCLWTFNKGIKQTTQKIYHIRASKFFIIHKLVLKRLKYDR